MERREPGVLAGSAVDALLAEGRALVADGQPEQGLACFRRAASGGSVLALFDLATCLMDLGRWTEAHAAFEQAATAGLAAVHRRAAEGPRAAAPAPVPTPVSAEAALRADAERDPAARAALGRLLHASGRVDEARRVLERGTALEERDSWLPLGNLLLDVFDDPVAAATAYRGGIDAGDVMCHSALGLLLRDLGDERGAAEEFRLGAGGVRPSADGVQPGVVVPSPRSPGPALRV